MNAVQEPDSTGALLHFDRHEYSARVERKLGRSHIAVIRVCRTSVRFCPGAAFDFPAPELIQQRRNALSVGR